MVMLVLGFFELALKRKGQKVILVTGFFELALKRNGNGYSSVLGAGSKEKWSWLL